MTTKNNTLELWNSTATQHEPPTHKEAHIRMCNGESCEMEALAAYGLQIESRPWVWFWRIWIGSGRRPI